MREAEIWQAVFVLPSEAAARLEAALEAEALSVSRFEAAPDGSLWRLEAAFAARPEADWLAKLAGVAPLQIEALAPRDWVSLSQAELPPIAAGRFYLHGSHDPPHPARQICDLLIDAGQAFGTGRHESTYGCLLLLDRWLRGRQPRRVLDLGCGSGVLAMAAARALPAAQVFAADIDPLAVRVARENARLNRLSARMRFASAPGLRHRAIGGAAPFDLIFANILARPLVSLAPEIVGHMARGGALILSGLLTSQEAMVRNAYRAKNLRLAARIRLQAWSSLLMVRETRRG